MYIIRDEKKSADNRCLTRALGGNEGNKTALKVNNRGFDGIGCNRS